MSTYVHANGQQFSDEDIERWVADAENGFAHSAVEPVSTRVWEIDTTPMVTKTLRIPQPLWEIIENRASETGARPTALMRQLLLQGLASF